MYQSFRSMNCLMLQWMCHTLNPKCQVKNKQVVFSKLFFLNISFRSIAPIFLSIPIFLWAYQFFGQNFILHLQYLRVAYIEIQTLTFPLANILIDVRQQYLIQLVEAAFDLNR